MSSKSETGLHEVGTGSYAYVQQITPTSWGMSNAGLITAGSTSMLVDTLYTLGQTQDMLDAMRAAVPAAKDIEIVVNSHADPDHTFGNQLLAGARIIATEKAARDMPVTLGPEQTRSLKASTKDMGAAGQFLERAWAPLDFTGIDLTLPTETFTGGRTLQVDGKLVELIELGPAHSRGDLIVYVPEDRVVFVGDLLFSGSHAVLWSGPVSNWSDACDFILDLDVEVIVAGHGPLSDKAGLREFRDYLTYLEVQATEMHGRGLDVMQAARAIDLSAYEQWVDRERIVVAVDTIYNGLEGKAGAPDYLRLFGQMEEFLQDG